MKKKTKKKEGLFYRFHDGRKRNLGKGKIILTLELDGDCCTIRNFYDGKQDESYRVTSKEQATVDIVALLNGFLPPRVLERRDIPSH